MLNLCSIHKNNTRNQNVLCLMKTYIVAPSEWCNTAAFSYSIHILLKNEKVKEKEKQANGDKERMKKDKKDQVCVLSYGLQLIETALVPSRHTTSFQCLIDVETLSCVYWVVVMRRCIG